MKGTKKLSLKIYNQLIVPIVSSTAPVRQVSWGVALGVFIGLTPTMGVQMYLVAVLWWICRVCRFHFHLPVGVAMVWITNPITVVPFYYGFLVLGNLCFQAMRWPTVHLDWPTFQHKFEAIAQNSLWELFQEGSRFFLIDLGLPLATGSLFVAIPFAVLSYFLTSLLLKRYRQYQAEQANLTYEEWRMQYETAN